MSAKQNFKIRHFKTNNNTRKQRTRGHTNNDITNNIMVSKQNTQSRQNAPGQIRHETKPSTNKQTYKYLFKQATTKHTHGNTKNTHTPHAKHNEPKTIKTVTTQPQKSTTGHMNNKNIHKQYKRHNIHKTQLTQTNKLHKHKQNKTNIHKTKQNKSTKQSCRNNISKQHNNNNN